MNILLGVSGGIAAYKACELVRALQRAGHVVRVMMTASAETFVTPLTFQALTGYAVSSPSTYASTAQAMDHIDLPRWCDCIIIAPATADTMARLAMGRANDPVTSAVLAAAVPIYIVPAMNQQMWRHPATQAHCDTLRAFGYHHIGPDEGLQACGDTGPGRMVSVDTIVAAIEESSPQPMPSILMTVGPTQEPIDPVRFLSNRSTGAMGYALAACAVARGAKVTVIAGPTTCPAPAGLAKLIPVDTAQDMYAAVMAECDAHDVVIGAAAVADYRPAHYEEQKIKKSSADMSLTLVRNPDILRDLGQRTSRPFLVGFAAETHAVLDHARQKMIKKNLDMMVANQVGRAEGFGDCQTAVTVLTGQGDQFSSGIKKDKVSVADFVLNHIFDQYARQNDWVLSRKRPTTESP